MTQKPDAARAQHWNQTDILVIVVLRAGPLLIRVVIVVVGETELGPAALEGGRRVDPVAEEGGGVAASTDDRRRVEVVRRR